MIESYFDYTLAQCSDSVISSVCSIYETKAALSEAARRGFNGTDYILGQGLLIFAALDFISENGYFKSSELDSDARKIYERCGRKLAEMDRENNRHIDIDREYIFNVLVDLNWLFSSKYTHVKKKQDGLISLLFSPSIIRLGLQKGLREVLYEAACYYKERSEQYKTAQLTKYQFLPGLHPDTQVRNMFSQGYTNLDFKELYAQASECSIRHMALFYGLTATAAKAEQIRRMR